MQPQRLAEVAVQRATPVVEVLDVQRGVEAEPMPEVGDVGRRGALSEHLHDRIAGNQVNEKEDDGDNDPEDR